MSEDARYVIAITAFILVVICMALLATSRYIHGKPKE